MVARRRVFRIVALAVIALGGGAAAAAEEHAIRAEAALEGRARVFVTGPRQAFLVGVFTGRLAAEPPSSALNGARVACPVAFDVDDGARTLRGDGRCVMTTGSGDRLFARWSCVGEPAQACAGQYVPTGGTGAFQGVTGGGELVVRLVLSELLRFDRLEAEYDVTGRAVWPELRYRTP